MLNLRAIALALLLGLSIGGAGGYYVKARFVKADQADAMVEVRKEDANGVVEAQMKDAEVIAAVEKTNETSRAIKRAIAKVQPVGVTHEQNQPGAYCPDDPYLSVGLVRLLDSAREGTAPDSAQRPDAEEQAPSQTRLSDFAENDAEVVRMYHELAECHDALVEWVQEQLNKQRSN